MSEEVHAPSLPIIIHPTDDAAMREIYGDRKHTKKMAGAMLKLKRVRLPRLKLKKKVK